jgi:hypothetical protein
MPEDGLQSTEVRIVLAREIGCFSSSYRYQEQPVIRKAAYSYGFSCSHSPDRPLLESDVIRGSGTIHLGQI